MTRDPRAHWDNTEFGSEVDRGSNKRLAALLPQLEAADTLADTSSAYTEADLAYRRHAAVCADSPCGECDRLLNELDGIAELLWHDRVAYLTARDAHLTEGEPT